VIERRRAENSAGTRVVRGGSWNNDARNVRAAYRNHNDPDDRNDNLGFRCARAHERVGGSAPEQACLRGVVRRNPASPIAKGGRRAGRSRGARRDGSPAGPLRGEKA